MKSPMKQPMQPLYIDQEGILRFHENAIVRHLLDGSQRSGGPTLNDIARMDFTQEDREQFAQLIGYSLSGYSELSYVSDESFSAASLAAKLLQPLPADGDK